MKESIKILLHHRHIIYLKELRTLLVKIPLGGVGQIADSVESKIGRSDILEAASDRHLLWSCIRALVLFF